MEKNFFLLKFIAQNNGLGGEFTSSTSKISQEFGLSQQSISRKLRELATLNLISFDSSPFGVRAKITREGKDFLQEQLMDLEDIFFKKKHKKLFGIVQSGLGEGKYYMAFKQYSIQIQEKLGFVPFVGTLNLKVNESELLSFKKELEEIYIGGFKTKERSFGGLKSYPVKINSKINGAIIFPDRSNLPPTTAELIAPISLRKKFSLKDGDKIFVEKLK